MDLTSAAIESLREFLSLPLPPEMAGAGGKGIGELGVKTRAGWPSMDEELVYPTVAIDAPASGERSLHAPIVLALLGVDGHPEQVDAVVGVAAVTQLLALDVFASSKFQRGEVVRSLELVLGMDASDTRRSCIVAPHYFGQVIGFQRTETFRFADTAGRVRSDEWRAVSSVRVDAEDVVVLRFPRLLELRVGVEVSARQFSSGTPSDIRTVFAP